MAVVFPESMCAYCLVSIMPITLLEHAERSCVQQYQCSELWTILQPQQDQGSRRFSPATMHWGLQRPVPICGTISLLNRSQGHSQTHTAAAVDCHLRWSTVRWLFIHASILVPHVDRTRDVATVESAHRAGVRRAERVEVRRQPWASDCARTKDWTRITAELRSAERRMEKRRDDAEVCCGAGPECLPAKKS